MGKINKEELKELFIEFKNGSQQEFEKLYTKYNKLVYGIAFSILKNQQDAEDIVQIVFTKIYGIEMTKQTCENDDRRNYNANYISIGVSKKKRIIGTNCSKV